MRGNSKHMISGKGKPNGFGTMAPVQLSSGIMSEETGFTTKKYKTGNISSVVTK